MKEQEKALVVGARWKSCSCEILHSFPKGKYVIILEKDKKEEKILKEKYDHLLLVFDYPKRHNRLP